MAWIEFLVQYFEIILRKYYLDEGGSCYEYIYGSVSVHSWELCCGTGHNGLVSFLIYYFACNLSSLPRNYIRHANLLPLHFHENLEHEPIIRATAANAPKTDKPLNFFISVSPWIKGV